MKPFLILVIQLLFSTINFGNNNCFEEKTLVIASQINYPQRAIENGIEEQFWFKFHENQIVLDSSKNHFFFDIFKSSIEDVRWQSLLEECEVNNIPKSFCIEFKLGKTDSIYLSNQIFTIQKKSTRFILNPAKEECSFYINSKLRINKKSSWNTSFNYKKGRNTVFKYLFIHEESPYWSDDEKIEGVYFQIPNSLKEFSYEGNLLEIKLFYESICEGRCYRRTVNKGLVSGKLINGEWIIKLSIDELSFDNKFIPFKNKK
jgi:hypothetical protein